MGEGVEPGATPTRAQMTWAQRLRRVFDIDVSRCSHCGAALRILAVITDPRVIAVVLAPGGPENETHDGRTVVIKLS